jgi:hypothetical protein
MKGTNAAELPAAELPAPALMAKTVATTNRRKNHLNVI